eukprot:gnl/Spiro4/16999_TR9167_c0_g1_i1.p1 gnl/Spiro4/16999_TR9167_c0_g1~~gnl/Spiro4/16999_TR9167_c0_g1_i1.p1  ORF type:complete len:351 (-),score=30.40 gnl/Spiro4/16999_TR9167_c0_g1_i1:9-1061(-)
MEPQRKRPRPPSSSNEEDEFYFDSYHHLSIHEEMLKDTRRTEAYRHAIEHYASRIRGAVVLDVGCGTGVLSIFCARVGARKVYAVDASGIATFAQRIVDANGFSDVISVFHSKIEDVELPSKVDVIVSEWMGYCLIYESMLPSVILARDKWLVPGGLLLPSHAHLFLAPTTDRVIFDERVAFWDNVYGIDMSCLRPYAARCAFSEPTVESVAWQDVLSTPEVVLAVDMATVTLESLQHVESRFHFRPQFSAGLHGFAMWFDVWFGPPAILTRPHHLRLSTGPETASTHWQQTTFALLHRGELIQDQDLSGTIVLKPNPEWKRTLDIKLSYSSIALPDSPAISGEQEYEMK